MLKGIHHLMSGSEFMILMESLKTSHVPISRLLVESVRILAFAGSTVIVLMLPQIIVAEAS